MHFCSALPRCLELLQTARAARKSSALHAALSAPHVWKHLSCTSHGSFGSKSRICVPWMLGSENHVSYAPRGCPCSPGTHPEIRHAASVVLVVAGRPVLTLRACGRRRAGDDAVIAARREPGLIGDRVAGGCDRRHLTLQRRGRALLQDMGKLMGEQLAAVVRRGCVGTGGEDDVGADGVGQRTDGTRRRGRSVVAMDTHVRQVTPSRGWKNARVAGSNGAPGDPSASWTIGGATVAIAPAAGLSCSPRRLARQRAHSPSGPGSPPHAHLRRTVPGSGIRITRSATRSASRSSGWSDEPGRPRASPASPAPAGRRRRATRAPPQARRRANARPAPRRRAQGPRLRSAVVSSARSVTASCAQLHPGRGVDRGRRAQGQRLRDQPHPRLGAGPTATTRTPTRNPRRLDCLTVRNGPSSPWILMASTGVVNGSAIAPARTSVATVSRMWMLRALPTNTAWRSRSYLDGTSACTTLRAIITVSAASRADGSPSDTPTWMPWTTSSTRLSTISTSAGPRAADHDALADDAQVQLQPADHGLRGLGQPSARGPSAERGGPPPAAPSTRRGAAPDSP